jgi:hypothetical protein
MRCGGLRAGTRGAGAPPVPIMRPCPELAEDRLAYSKRYRRVRTGCGALTAKARPHRQKIALRGQALRRGANEAAFAVASGPRERGQNGTLSRGLLARNDLNNELSNWMKPQMKNWKRKLWTPATFMAPVILSLPGFAGLAAAEQPSAAQASAIRSACRSDYQSHCSGVPTGGAAALQCLQKNVASLSPGCQQAVKAVGGASPASPAASTAATPATATPPASASSPPAATGAPAGSATLMVKTAPATSAGSVKSAAAKQPTKAQADAIRSACRSDYQSYCPGIKPGSTAAWSCLQAKVASFSGPCQQAVYAVTGGNPAETAVATPKISAPPAATPVQLPITRVVTPRQVLSLMHTACGSDFRTFCPGVALGGGRALSCLEDKAASLSLHCKSALDALSR